VRRIIPTAERTVTRGGDKKPLTKETRLENAPGKGFYERLCNRVGCSHVGMDGPASPDCQLIARGDRNDGGGLCK
jgi:hypothetical protein